MNRFLSVLRRECHVRNCAWWFMAIALVFGGSCAGAVEREFYFDRIDSDSGLLQNSIYSLLQTDDGKIWIGTQGGLHQFDGYRFKVYEHDGDDPASLPDSATTALARGANDQIWVGTAANGVARLDPVSGKFDQFALPLDSASRNAREAITSLWLEPGRGLWIGSRGGLGLLDPATGERRPFTAENSNVPIGVVRELLLSSDGSVWAASSTGLWRVPRGADHAEKIDAGALGSALSLFEGEDRSLYVGNEEGLYRVDPAIGKSHQIWASKGNGPVNAIVEDPSGQLWMAIGGQGLLIFDRRQASARWIRPDSEVAGGLPQAAVTQLLMDRSGLLWVGTDAVGLSKVNPAGATFSYIADRDRIPGRDPSRDLGTFNNIRSILEDRAGDIWLGTDGDGLKRFDRRSAGFTHYDAAIAEAFGETFPTTLQVESLAEDARGIIWFACNLGVGSIDPASGKVRILEQSPAEIADGLETRRRALIITRDGGIWYAGRSVGVVRYDPGTGQWRNWRHRDGDRSSLTHDHVMTLYEDSSGRVWAGSADGLNLIDPSSDEVRTFLHEADNPQSLSSGVVRSIHESADGGIWIGTHGGLNHLARLDDGPARFERVLKRDGLPDATIYGILEDVMGRLWLSTNRGIVSYNPASRGIHQFSVKDGLQGQEFNGGAYAALRGGELAFGGTNGLNLVKPGTVVGSRFVAPVVFSDIRVGEESLATLAPDQPVEMDQADRVVHFTFAALDYTAPERNRFRYKLEGFDDGWVEAGTRHEATYTNLDPGRYRFLVQASNHDGYWNQSGTGVDLVVKPQWWNSRVMRAGYAALVLLSLLGLALAVLRKRAQLRRHARELLDREARLRLALWGSSDEFWELNMDSGVLTRLNASPTPARQRETNLSVYDWVRESVHPDDQRAIAQHLDDHISNKASLFESEQRIRTHDGKWMWVLARGKIVERTPEGRPLRICGTARNITASRDAERERRIVQEVISSMREAVTVCDLEFRFVSVNPAFTRITGWQEHEVIGQSAAILNCAQHSPEYYQNMRESITREGLWRGELWQRRKDGEEFLSWLQSSEVRDAQGKRTHYIGVLTDITERKRNEQELRYLANYDTLTGLPNRTLMAERLGHAVIRARRGGRKVAVLFLDLDRFKHVNDSMGHAAGDRMLKAAGSRLRDNVRDGDTVARIGGDEFTVVLEELADAGEAERVAQKLISAFEKPLELNDGQDVVISPSIGISLYPDHAQTPTDLLKFADTAMYQAKDRGRKTFMVYTETMDAAARMRATLVGALRKAMERGEFRLVYQPKLSLLDEHITGVEALLRWNSQDLGEISPVTFIPVAEESGLIVEIGDWVLVKACEQLAKWHRDGLRDISMSVNLSVLQLQRGDLTQRLCDILADNDMAPNQLELELTESVIMANAEQSISTLRQLKAVGVTLSIDDFGTGYSSLSYLRRLPIDALKIDKEFVGDITTDPDDEAITATVINMAHSLGLNVVAEGVETAEQAEYLREQGCDEIQGHWLSIPLPPEACFTFLRDRARKRQEVLGDQP